MQYLEGEEVFEKYLSDTLHGETQIEPRSVSLTAGGIHNITGTGELDFGGSEYQLGDRHEVQPQLRNDEDDYGWWKLSQGSWLLELNEKLAVSSPFDAVLQPHDHLLWNGSTHSSLWLSENDTGGRLMVPLSVPENGINIKENARVSSLRVLA